MYRWIGQQQDLEPEDIVQDAWLGFSKKAPSIPGLVEGEQLDTVLAYLRTCTKNALFMQARKRKELELFPSKTEGHISSIELRLEIQQCIKRLLLTDEERQIYLLRFEYGFSTQQIIDQYPESFPDKKEVSQIIQRIRRRMRKDEELQDLRNKSGVARRKIDSGASLEFRMIKNDSDHKKDQTVTEECNVGEAVLLDYITGMATAEEKAAVESALSCMKAAKLLADSLLPYMSILYRVSCPDVEMLIDYQEKRATGTEALVIHAHVEQCPLCSRELSQMQQIDEVPLAEPAGLIRRIVEAIFQPPATLPQAVRGSMLRYQAPQVLIHIGTRKDPGQARTWTMTGQVRDNDGQLVTNVEQVILHKIDPDNIAWEKGEIPEKGKFIFRKLQRGQYSISVLTDEEEIVIRQIGVGDKV
ncbi:hypothetical protein KFU94_11115 [Chloroflexi bacterium TSY]|nr:hypothetical protein [Chloroflexi bacterium TSY]